VTEQRRSPTEEEQAHFPPRAGSANLAEYFAPLVQLCGVARRTGVWLELVDR
jgi:hypothetical protein